MWLWGSKEKPGTFYTVDTLPEMHRNFNSHSALNVLNNALETDRRMRQDLTSSKSSTILLITSLSSLLWHISAVTTPRTEQKRHVWRCVLYIFSACVCVICLLLQPQDWMKKLMRSRRDESLSATYASIQSSITTCSTSHYSKSVQVCTKFL